jgi:hypothetical protein
MVGTYLIHFLSPCFRPWFRSILPEKLPPVFELLYKADSVPGTIIVKNPLKEKHNVISLGSYKLKKGKICVLFVRFGALNAL